MRKVPPTALLVLALCTAAPALHPQGSSSWIAATDRSSNPIVGEILCSGPLETRLDVAQSLGLRRDPYIADLIESLIGAFHGTKRYEEELVLRVLLDSVFPRTLAAEQMLQRVGANESAVELLARRLPELGAPLARETYRLLTTGARLRSALAAEGSALVDALEGRNGYSNSEQADRLVAYLEAVDSTGDGVFAGAVVSVLELTRTPEVGRYSREVLGRLLAANPHQKVEPSRTGDGNPAGW